MSTLRKHGEKWQSIVRVSGHPAIYKSFKSKTDATRWAALTEVKLRREDAQLKVSLLTPIPTTVTQPEPKNTYLDDLETQRKDPDLFKGLGTFLHKKI